MKRIGGDEVGSQHAEWVLVMRSGSFGGGGEPYMRGKSA